MTTTDIIFLILFILFVAGFISYMTRDSRRITKKLSKPEKENRGVPKFKNPPPPPPKPEKPKEWEAGESTYEITITYKNSESYYHLHISKEVADQIKGFSWNEKTLIIPGLLEFKNRYSDVKQQATLIFPPSYLADCGIAIKETNLPKRCGEEEGGES